MGIVVVYAAENVEEVRTASVKTSMPRAGGGFLKKFRYSQLEVTIPGHPMLGNLKLIPTVCLSSVCATGRATSCLTKLSRVHWRVSSILPTLEVFSSALNPTLIYFHLGRVLDPSISQIGH